MKLVAISDTHEQHTALDGQLPEGDIIICSGDITYTGKYDKIKEFTDWYKNLPYRHKILVAGNHDWGFQTLPDIFEELCDGIHYLNDSGVYINGVKFWGSPVQPEFCNWAFNKTKEEIIYHWNRIPEDTDVLITHGPPHGILDRCPNGYHAGCPSLLAKIDMINPKVHIFGHIHDSYGKLYDGSTKFINASICNERYNPVNKPIVIEI